MGSLGSGTQNGQSTLNGWSQRLAAKGEGFCSGKKRWSPRAGASRAALEGPRRGMERWMLGVSLFEKLHATGYLGL